MLKKNDIWEKITTSLKSTIPKSETKKWFSHTNLKKIDSDLAVIEVPNKFVASWLHDNYVTQIQESFKSNLNFLPEIRFAYSTPTTTKYMPEYNINKKSHPHFSHGLNSSWTFDNFVTAKSNQFAYSSALEVINNPASAYNPLYLFSTLSFGKTHLLNAIGNKILNTRPLLNVRYVSVDRFSSDFSLANRHKNLATFREYHRKLDFLLLDDIHLLSGREKTQEELTSLLNTFYESNKQIVIAGKSTPKRITNLLPQLRSRMEWGLLTEIQAPHQRTKIQIIKQKAKQQNLNIPDDVTFFLANSTSDLKTLIQYLVALQTHFSLYQRQIDMSTVKLVIKDTRFRNITINDIQKVTAGYFDISISDLLSRKKTRKFSYPRQVAMYLSRKLTDLSFKEIGSGFGNKDHSTVIYAINSIEKTKNTKREVLDDINNLQAFLFK